MQFAELAGGKYPTFALWVQRRKKTRAAAGGDEAVDGAAVGTGGTQRLIRLFEAVVAEPGAVPRSGEVLPVELPGGRRLLVQGPGQLRSTAELSQAHLKRGL